MTSEPISTRVTDEQGAAAAAPAVTASRRARRGGRRLALVGAAGALLLTAAPVGRSAGTDDVAGVRSVGSIPRVPGCGITYYTVDSGLGLFVAVYTESAFTGTCGGSQATNTWAVLYSTSTLQQVDRVLLRAPQQPDQFLPPLVDTVRHRLILVGSPTSGQSPPVYEYDLRALSTATGAQAPKATFTSSLPTAPSASSATTGAQDPSGTLGDSAQTLRPLNAAYDAATDSLDVTMYVPGSPYSSNAPTQAEDEYLAEVDATTGAQRFFTRLGQCVIPQQNSPLDATDKDPVLHFDSPTGNAVAVGCGYVNAAVVASNASSGSGEVITTVVSLGPDGKPTGLPVAYLGKTNALGGIADAQTGRMFFLIAPSVQTGGAAAQGPSAITFDVAHRAYVGAATVNSAVAAVGGFATAVGAGRLYAAGPGGVFVSDAGSTPVDPGLIYPAFGCAATALFVDAVQHRLFVLPQDPCKALAGRIAVLEDDSTLLPTKDADPDRNTHDIAEQPGTTQTTFSGRATGTALRVRVVGGVTSLENGLTEDQYDNDIAGPQALVPPQGLDLVARVPNAQPVIARDFSNREIDLASVSASDLDNVQANAAAIAGAFDDTSASNLGQATTVANPPVRASGSGGASGPLVAGQQVPFQQAACSAPARPTQSTAYAAAPGTAPDTASATCAQGTRVGADAASHALGVALGGTAAILSVGDGEVTTSVTRDSGEGVVATVTSTVHGLRVGPVLVNAVTTTTTCHAHGRPHTAQCTFAREISGVFDGGSALAPASCSETDTGGTGSRGCAQLIAELNSLTPGKLVFAAPQPDLRRGFLGGSPGGYQAVAERELYQHLENALLDNDNSLSVPGLDILYVNDTESSPSRIELQVAGGEAEAHYGINPPIEFGAIGGAGGLLSGLPLTAGGLPGGVTTGPVGTLGGGELRTAAGAGAGSGGAPAATGPVSLSRVLASVWDSVNVLGRSPGTGVLIAALLGVLALPLVTAWRRGRLLRALGRGR